MAVARLHAGTDPTNYESGVAREAVQKKALAKNREHYDQRKGNQGLTPINLPMEPKIMASGMGRWAAVTSG